MLELTGKTFGRLTVQKYFGQNKQGFSLWLCSCECGKEKIVIGAGLKRGAIASCGCLQKDGMSKIGKSNKTHGLSRRPIFKVWGGMLRRCSDEKSKDWKDYGGRGITVCERWQKIENFYADMGDVPYKMSLDRIDNSKGYSLENCKWSTLSEQANNKRSNLRIEYKGKAKNLVEWCRELNLKYSRIYARLQRGAAVNEAFQN